MQRRLIATDGTAVVTAVNGTARVALEVRDDSGALDIRVLDPATGDIRSLGTAALPGLRLMAPAARSLSAVRLPAGEVALGPDGRFPDVGSGQFAAFLLRLIDGAVSPLTGVLP